MLEFKLIIPKENEIPELMECLKEWHELYCGGIEVLAYIACNTGNSRLECSDTYRSMKARCKSEFGDGLEYSVIESFDNIPNVLLERRNKIVNTNSNKLYDMIVYRNSHDITASMYLNSK